MYYYFDPVRSLSYRAKEAWLSLDAAKKILAKRPGGAAVNLYKPCLLRKRCP